MPDQGPEDEHFHIRETAAQDLRLFPSLGDEITGKCYADLQCRYEASGMMRHHPFKALDRITRGLHSVTWGAGMHMLYSRLFFSLAPQLEHQAELAAAAERAYPFDLYALKAFEPSKLSQAEHRFMSAGIVLLREASEGLLQATDPYTVALLRQVREGSELRITGKHQRLAWETEAPVPRETSPKNWIDLWHIGLIDNLNATRELLRLRQRAARKARSAEWLGQTTLRNLERLSWAASVNKVTLATIKDTTSSLHGLRETGDEDQPLCSYAHPSLHDGPWPKRQLCSGQYLIRSPFAVERQQAQYTLHLLGIPSEDGAFRTNDALLGMGIKLAQETFWQPK